VVPDADPGATGIAALIASFLFAAIYFGSGGLKYFDAALVGYATLTIFLVFGVTQSHLGENRGAR
jgi:hypothetical protein